MELEKAQVTSNILLQKELTTEISVKQSPEILKIIYVFRIKNFYQTPNVSHHKDLGFCRIQPNYKEEIRCITRSLKYPAFGAAVMPRQFWS